MLYVKFLSFLVHALLTPTTTLCKSDIVRLDFVLFVVTLQVFFPLCCSSHILVRHSTLWSWMWYM